MSEVSFKIIEIPRGIADRESLKNSADRMRNFPVPRAGDMRSLRFYRGELELPLKMNPYHVRTACIQACRSANDKANDKPHAFGRGAT